MDDPVMLSKQMRRKPPKTLFRKLKPLYLENGIFFHQFLYIFPDYVKF